MNFITRVLKEYKCIIDPKTVSTHGVNTSKPSESIPVEPGFLSNPLIWPKEFLPYTKYMTDNASEARLDKLERLKLEPLNFKSKRLVQVLTRIDLDLILAIAAEDLLNYNGHPETISIQHAYNAARGLTTIFSSNFKTTKLFKMLEYSVLYKNYNLIYILIKSLQNKRLSYRKVKKISYYQKLLDRVDDGIFPLAWMLKDCEDSNMNIESDVASLRFCKIIDKMRKMKKIELGFKITEKQKHMVYSKIWEAFRNIRVENEASKTPYDYLYLIL